ncbi:fucose-specific lectin [Rhexocercosporidium sp. MPI-PUGE-AT-0058]|nr:fucose-specific lectin [Rhexocercosporidium sp. MPI-PUGE-AT-0058]
MSSSPIEQIAFRTAIAAVNSTNHLRVYSQDVLGGIRESSYEDGWTGGVNVLSTAKRNSPIAAAFKGLEKIRLYSMSSDNKLREFAYDSNVGWYDGTLNKSNFALAPYSQIAATALLPNKDFNLRIYVQIADKTIQEYGYDNPSSGWQKMSNLGPALAGTSIAVTSYGGPTGLSIRVYFQKPDLSITELCHDSQSTWYTGSLSIPASSVTPRASLACTNFNDTKSGISLRLYYSSPHNTLLEKGFDGNGWYDGGFEQKTIPGSKISVISWQKGSEIQIRIYFQKGKHVTAVTEWVWDGAAWTAGVPALPPA